METRVMEITPAIADNWLKNNTNRKNRKLSHERVAQYARAMLSGNWVLTHQGIAFDTNGDLIDGQTRLNAVVKAGVPVMMNVTTGVECDGLMEIDTGRTRTYNNIMTMAGVKDRVFLTMNGVVSVFINQKMGIKSKRPAHEINEYIINHYEPLAYIAKYYGFNGTDGKNPGSRHAPSIVAAAALSALYWGERRDALEKFGLVWCSNDPTFGTGYSTRLLFECKDRLRNMKVSPETFNYVENVIRCFANGNKIVKVIDCYPLDSSYAH